MCNVFFLNDSLKQLLVDGVWAGLCVSVRSTDLLVGHWMRSFHAARSLDCHSVQVDVDAAITESFLLLSEFLQVTHSSCRSSSVPR